jgi:SNF2 family DNA or RNA helicase
MKGYTAASQRLLKPVPLDSRDQIELSLDHESTKFHVKMYQVSVFDGTRCQASWQSHRFAERIPERKQLSQTSYGFEWSFAATDITAVLISISWKPEQIHFFDEFTRLSYQYLIATYHASNFTAETAARYKEYKEVPGLRVLRVNWMDMEIEQFTVTDLEMHEDFPLSPYQQVATHCALNNEGYALFMHAGTGKTPVAIATWCNEAIKPDRKRAYRTLVVCPKNVRVNWVDEIEKFASIKGKVSVLRGGAINRIKILLDAMMCEPDEQFTTVIVSYETMRIMIEALKRIEWDLVVLDEGHFIKWPGTKRAKASMILREVGRRRLLLTGTPVANSPLDIYSQLEFLGKGWSGFISWGAFKEFYGVFDKHAQNGGDKLVALQNLPFMKERLASKSFIITKEEALPDLPDKVYDVIEVTMIPEQRKAYDQIRRDLILEIERDLENVEESKKSMVIQNSLVKLLRLAQITSGFVTWDAVLTEDGDVISPKEIEFFSPNAKIDALVEVLKEKGPNDKTIIWACWIPDIKAICHRLNAEGISHVSYYGGTSDKAREDAIGRFNGDIATKVFVGNPAAGGVGVNLLGYPPGHPEEATTNANHVIYFSQDWSSIKRSQSEDRAHRRGTREPVRITDLCVAGTIDEEIRARVIKKRTIAFEILDVRNILKAVIKGVVDEE